MATVGSNPVGSRAGSVRYGFERNIVPGRATGTSSPDVTCRSRCFRSVIVNICHLPGKNRARNPSVPFWKTAVFRFSWVSAATWAGIAAGCSSEGCGGPSWTARDPACNEPGPLSSCEHRSAVFFPEPYQNLAVPTVGQTSRYMEFLQDAYRNLTVPQIQRFLQTTGNRPGRIFRHRQRIANGQLPPGQPGMGLA